MNQNTNISLPPHLQEVKKLVFDKIKRKISGLQINAESYDYEACSFQLNDHSIIFRVSKITPTKTGQFVSIWKRNEEGVTAPLDESDNFDFIMIASKKKDKMGLFIFPKAALVEQGVISNAEKGGKRGIRVYPPWDMVISTQAIKSQGWQIDYFIFILPNCEMDLDLAKVILCPNRDLKTPPL